MRTVDSYLVQLESGAKAWLAVGKQVPSGATVIEVRPMLMPDDGMVLWHKHTVDTSTGYWLNGADCGV